MRLFIALLAACGLCGGVFAEDSYTAASASIQVQSTGFDQGNGSSGPFNSILTSAPNMGIGNGISASAFARADLPTGTLRASAGLSIPNAPEGSNANTVFANSVFADSFRHESNGSPFVFDGSQAASFTMDLDGTFGDSGSVIFGELGAFLRVVILEPGTLEREGNPFSEDGRLILGSPVLQSGFIEEFTVDLTGESLILSADPGAGGVVAPDISGPKLPSTIDFQFDIDSDFDFIIGLTTRINAFTPTTAYDASVDFSNTIGVTYNAPGAVDSVVSGSGVFPGTVPAPGACTVLLIGAWVFGNRRR